MPSNTTLLRTRLRETRENGARRPAHPSGPPSSEARLALDGTRRATHAVVIGGSLAGLLAARVLSDHVDTVTLVERDALTDHPEARRGVPQGRHVHGLLTRGERILARLFPDLERALRGAGAIFVDTAADMRWHHFGGCKVRFQSGIVGPVCSRPLLEAEVRKCVLALPNVWLLDGHDAVGLVPNESHTRVVGVTLRGPNSGAGERWLRADLVVDSSGRGSRAPAWLDELGFQPPDVSEVKIDVGYTSRLYHRRPDDLMGAKLVMSSPTPPEEKRFGVLFPIEGDRWLMTLGGWLGDHPPTDHAGFRAFAQSLPATDLGRIAARAEPLGDLALHKVPSSLRRHYERLDRAPEGFLAIGDAVCSFNPIYGQGITVAALEAEELECCLREGTPGRSWTGLPRRFYARIASVVDASWTMAVGEDFRFPEVTGPKPPGTDLTNWYMGYVHRATLSDPVVCREFLRVMSMLKPPSSLFHPAIVARALWEGAVGPARPRSAEPSREAA